MSFQVSPPIEGNRETFSKIGNQEGNSMETTSLKALANKVLQRNQEGNSMETECFQGRKLKGEKVSTVSDTETIGNHYQLLIRWLKQYDVNGFDIREIMPGIHIALQSAIEELDRAMIETDIQGFTGAAEKIKKLYLDAVAKMEG